MSLVSRDVYLTIIQLLGIVHAVMQYLVVLGLRSDLIFRLKSLISRSLRILIFLHHCLVHLLIRIIQHLHIHLGSILYLLLLFEDLLFLHQLLMLLDN